MAKTGSKSRKFEGEGATSKEQRVVGDFPRWGSFFLHMFQEEKKKKNQANVKKRSRAALVLAVLALYAKALFDLGVSKNNGTPKSSILIGFCILNHPFWGSTPIFGLTPI